MRPRTLITRPNFQYDTRRGLYTIQSSMQREGSAGGIAVPSAAVLRAAVGRFIGLSGGGGSQVNSSGLVASNATNNLVAGDLLLYFVHTEWGCTTTPNDTPVGVTDNTGNLWHSLVHIFIDTGYYSPLSGVAAYSSKFTHECLYAIHGGGALNTINVTSAIDPNAWDVQGNSHLSCWNSSGRIPIFDEVATNRYSSAGAGQTAFAPNFRSAKNRVNVWSSLQSSGNGSGAYSGAAGPQFGGIDLTVAWYMLQYAAPDNRIITPTLNLANVAFSGNETTIGRYLTNLCVYF